MKNENPLVLSENNCKNLYKAIQTNLDILCTMCGDILLPDEMKLSDTSADNFNIIADRAGKALSIFEGKDDTNKIIWNKANRIRKNKKE
ncbi:MAG: hypothetical protein AABY32_01225 [Nanoarchaeota archaeon]